MGTEFKIILYAQEEKIAQNAANQAIKKIDQLNQIFSDYLEDSELTVGLPIAQVAEKN